MVLKEESSGNHTKILIHIFKKNKILEARSDRAFN